MRTYNTNTKFTLADIFIVVLTFGPIQSLSDAIEELRDYFPQEISYFKTDFMMLILGDFF